jgi:hypothetical protein
MDVEWKKIPGYSRYSASENGEIRRDIDMGSRKAGLVNIGCEIRGYLIVSIQDDAGVNKTPQVHGLVAAAFIGEKPVGMQVCHNDGNRKNNHQSNLRYDTASENTKDKIKHGTMPFGTKAKNAKLTEEDIPKIVALLADQKHTQKQIGEMFGVSQRTIWHVATGKKWKHITGGLCQPRPGRGARKLTDQQVVEIRNGFESGKTRLELAKEFNVSHSNICMIIKGTSRKRIEGVAPVDMARAA